MAELKCKYCQMVFANKGEMMTHYRLGCPEKPADAGPDPGDEDAAATGEPQAEAQPIAQERKPLAPPPAPEEAGPAVLPARVCPSEFRYLSEGKTVAVVVIGRLRGGGLAVDSVQLRR